MIYTSKCYLSSPHSLFLFTWMNFSVSGALKREHLWQNITIPFISGLTGFRFGFVCHWMLFEWSSSEQTRFLAWALGDSITNFIFSELPSPLLRDGKGSWGFQELPHWSSEIYSRKDWLHTSVCFQAEGFWNLSCLRPNTTFLSLFLSPVWSLPPPPKAFNFTPKEATERV